MRQSVDTWGGPTCMPGEWGIHAISRELALESQMHLEHQRDVDQYSQRVERLFCGRHVRGSGKSYRTFP
jgi:hypothetical protein